LLSLADDMAERRAVCATRARNFLDHAVAGPRVPFRVDGTCSGLHRPKTFDRFHARFGAWGLGPPAPQTSHATAEAVFAVCPSRHGEPPRRLGVRIEDGEIFVLGRLDDLTSSTVATCMRIASERR